MKQQATKYMPLKDLVSFKMGKVIKKLSILRQEGKLSNGLYDIISSAIKPIGKWNEFNTDGNTITITKDGDCGNVAWHTQPFWATEHSITLINNVPSTINSKYLFYYLKAIENQIKELKVQSAPDFLRIDDLKQIEVPVPNLETQNQIVNILDRFLHLTNQLTSELTSELTSRNHQYQYYLKTLLDFSKPQSHPLLIKNGGGGN